MVCTEMTLFAGGKLFKRKSLCGDGTEYILWYYSQGFWEGGKPETLFPWGESGRIIYRVLGRQEIQNLIGGDKIITRGLARGENLTLYFHGKNH